MAEENGPPKAARTEIATIGGGRDTTRGFVTDGPMPPQDTILRQYGWFDWEIYKDVLRDDQVLSTFQQRRLAVVSREWTVEAGGNKRIDRQAADFLRENLASIPWDRISDAMLYGVYYGFAVAECIWEPDGGKWRLANIKVRDRARFRFNVESELLLLTMAQPNGMALPDKKFWTFSTGADHTDEPYGLGLAHWLYWPVFFKRNGLKFWLIFLDKFGSPSEMAKVPGELTDDAYDKALEALSALRGGGSIAVPEGMIIELIEASRSGTPDYETLHDKMNAAISKVNLSQTMTTDDGSSLSQSQTHGEVKDEVVKADSDLLCGSFNDGPVRWLTDWNFAGAAYPKVWRRVESEPDLKPVAERDKIIYDMGFTPTLDYIRETYGEGWEKRKPVTPPVPPGATPPPQNTGGEDADDEEDDEPAFAEHVTDAIYDLVDEILPDDASWEKLIGPSVAPILALAEEAEDLAEFRERLAEVLTDQDVRAVTEGLAKAAYAARLAGEVEAPIVDDES